jgi:DNA-binding transcriptional LysR family regulator
VTYGSTRSVVDADAGVAVATDHALAAAVVQQTNLIATLPNRLLDALTIPTSLSVIPTPAEITPISFSMAWHPRLDNDPAQQWLRKTIRAATSPDQTSSQR